MAKGIKKISAVKKQLITDLTVSSIATADRGAGDSCRIMLIKRDPVLLAIDGAFADHRRRVDRAVARSIADGTGAAGFGRRAAKLRKKLDAKLREVRQGVEVRPADRPDDRLSLAAGGDPKNQEQDDDFLDRERRHTARERAGRGGRGPAQGKLMGFIGDQNEDRSPELQQREDRAQGGSGLTWNLQKRANLQKRDGESDAQALERFITTTEAGRQAYRKERDSQLLACTKVYSPGVKVATSVQTGRETDDDAPPSVAEDPMAAADQDDDGDANDAYENLMDRARKEVMKGHFATEAVAFDALFKNARDPNLRALIKRAKGVAS
jgi:hypothetical protein